MCLSVCGGRHADALGAGTLCTRWCGGRGVLCEAGGCCVVAERGYDFAIYLFFLGGVLFLFIIYGARAYELMHSLALWHQYEYNLSIHIGVVR